MGQAFVDEATRATLAFVDRVVEDARERWRGAVTAETLEGRLGRLRDFLITHPVAMEYVARAMPRQTPLATKDTRNEADAGMEKASGDNR